LLILYIISHAAAESRWFFSRVFFVAQRGVRKVYWMHEAAMTGAFPAATGGRTGIPEESAFSRNSHKMSVFERTKILGFCPLRWKSPRL
jgi:hypothetical protein